MAHEDCKVVLMKEFTPTWLYIKQHSDTGLKYFGKTTNSPHGYNGSGKYWTRHLKKHGTNIETIWCKLFTDKTMLVEYALRFSAENKIVDSAEWANLKNENGLDGGIFGPITEEYKQKLKLAKTAEVKFKNGSSWRGKKQPKEVIDNRTKSFKDRVLSSEMKNSISAGVTASYLNPTDAMKNKGSKISAGNKKWCWVTNGYVNKKILRVDTPHDGFKYGRTL